MRTVLIVATLSLLNVTQAQQVDSTRSWILNGDFEKIETKKLKRPGAIELAEGWSSPTGEKADLFSENATKESNVSTPKNLAGDQMALSGSNYAGIRTWSYKGQQPRSYLQTQMKQRMKKDSLYCVRFYTTLGDLSKYATGELGVWLGNQKVVKSDEANLTYDITFPSVRDKVQKDMNSWQGICGVYQAKGSEHYLVIGNFASNEKTPNEKVKRPRGETRMQVNSAYYYIDNVEVYPVKDRSSCTCEQLKDAESEFIFSRKGAVNPNLKPSQRVDGQIYYYKRFQSTLDPSMEPWFTELVQDMKADPAIKIRLVGHTDATEMSRTRVRPDLAELAQQRAVGLRDALVEAGVETARITVVGKGSDEPSDTSGTDVGMSKNRRVEVELVP